MTVLHHLEAVALEVDVAIKVHLMERLERDLVGATVLGTVRLLLEVKVELNWATGVLGFLIASWTDGGNYDPPGSQEREIDNDGKEDKSLEATANLPLDVVGQAEQDG